MICHHSLHRSLSRYSRVTGCSQHRTLLSVAALETTPFGRAGNNQKRAKTGHCLQSIGALQPCWQDRTGLRRLTSRPTFDEQRRYLATRNTSTSSLQRTSFSSPNESIRGRDAINPPASARPPPLDLPTPSGELPRYKYYYQLGRGYLKFYKGALKQVWQNVKKSMSILARLNISSSLLISRGLKARLASTLAENHISRGEYLQLVRTNNDISKLPLFGLVLMVCGEFTPLLVKFLGPVIPKTAWLPTQWQQEKEKIQKRFWSGAQKMSKLQARQEMKDLPVLQQHSILRTEGHYVKKIFNAKDREISLDYRSESHPMSILHLNKPLTRATTTLLPLSLSTSNLEKQRQKIASELLVDDASIRRAGGVRLLSDEEVGFALRDRSLHFDVPELMIAPPQSPPPKLSAAKPATIAEDSADHNDTDDTRWKHLRYRSPAASMLPLSDAKAHKVVLQKLQTFPTELKLFKYDGTADRPEFSDDERIKMQRALLQASIEVNARHSQGVKTE